MSTVFFSNSTTFNNTLIFESVIISWYMFLIIPLNCLLSILVDINGQSSHKDNNMFMH